MARRAIGRARGAGGAGIGCAGAAALLLLLLVALLAGTWVFLRTERGNELLRERLEGAFEGLTPYGRVEIGRLETDVWNDLALYDVAVYDERGELLAWISRALIDVRPGTFITRQILRMPHVRLDGVYVDLELREDGVFNLARVFGQTEPGDPSDDEWRGLPVFLDVPDLVVDGGHVIHRDPDGEIVRATGIDLQTGIWGKETVELRDFELTALLARPGPTTVRAEGDAVWNHRGLRFIGTTVRLPRSQVRVDALLADTWDADVRIDRADFPTIDPLIEEPGLTGAYAGRLRITGPLERPTFGGTLTGIDGTVGQVALAVTVDFEADPAIVSGRVDAVDFHLHHLVPEVDEVVILTGGGDFTILADRYPEDFVLDVRWSGGPQIAYGQRAEHLSTHFRIEEGVLRILSGHVLGVVGDVDVTGTIDIEGGPMRLEVVGTAYPVYLADFGITGLGTPAAVDVLVTGNIHDLDVVRAAGTAAWSPFLYQDSVALDAVQAAFEAYVRPDEVVTGTGQAVGRGGTAFGVDVGEAFVPDLQFVVPLGGGGTSHFRGTIQGRDLAREGIFTAATASGPWALALPPDGDLVLEADLEVGDHTFFDFPGTSGSLRARLVGDVAQYELVLRQEGRDTVQSVGVVDLTAQRFDMSHLVLAPTPRATWTAVGSVGFTITDGGVADADVLLRSELGVVSLRGTIGTTGPVEAEILTRDFQLDTLAELFPDRLGDLSGRLDTITTISGRASDPVVVTQLAVKRLWVPDVVRWLDATGTIHATRDEVATDMQLAVADDPLGYIRGTVPVVLDLSDPGFATERDVDLLVAIRPGDLERFAYAFPALADQDLPEGRLSASLMATGPLGDPDFRIAGVAELPAAESYEPTRFEVDVRRDGGDLVFWADIREGLEQRASITGTGATRVDEAIRWALGEGPRPDLEDAELWIDDMVVNGILLGVPASTVARVAEADVVVTGELVGGFSVTGSPYEPQVEGGLHLLDGAIGEERLEGAWASVVPGEDAYDVELVLDFVDEGSIAVTGELPVRVDLRREVAAWPTGAIDLEITGEGLPLGALSGLDPGIHDAEGLLVLEGTVGGTIAEPMPDVTARIDGGQLVYDPLGLRFYDFRVEARLDARGIQVPFAVAWTEPTRRTFAGGLQDVTTSDASRIRVTGTAALDDWRIGAVEADAELLGGTWIAATPETQLRMNGRLAASGVWPDVGVTGTLSLLRGNVTIDTARFLSAAPLQLDESIVVVRPGVEPVAPVEEPPPAYTSFDVAIDLDVNRNLFLDMTIPWIEQLGTFGSAVTEAEIMARLGGRLQLTMREGQPALVGEVDVIDGEARVLRSEFDSLEGTLIWVGGDPANPNLDLFAQMNLSDGSLGMSISGTAEAPRIAFQSDAWPEQSQQLAILVTGRPPDDIGGNQATAAAETLAGVVLDALFEGQALSQVTIDPEGAVEVGLPIGADLYATTRVAPNADIDENRIEAQLEWSLGRRLVLAGAIGDREGWIDLFWEIRW